MSVQHGAEALMCGTLDDSCGEVTQRHEVVGYLCVPPVGGSAVLSNFGLKVATHLTLLG